MDVQIQISEEKVNIPFPKKWEDINGEMMLRIIPYLYADTHKHRLEILKEIFNKNKKYLYLLDTIQVYDLSKLLDWMYVVPFSTPHFEYFKIEGKKYLLPQKNLDYCCVVEYAFADNYYEEVASGDSEAMFKLIATLCRPAKKVDTNSPDFDGDYEEKFNEVLIQRRAALFKNKLSLNYVLYFFLFFTGCKGSFRKDIRNYFLTGTEEKAQISGGVG